MYNVLVLMSTYNGEKYIVEQVESVLRQKDVSIKLLIRDDGSKDNTVNIIKKMQDKYKNIDIIEGTSNLKSAFSFFELIKCCNTNYDYYAFCDQDDVWLEHKLIKGINKIKDIDKEAIYCCNYQLVDEKLNKIDLDNHFVTTNLKEAIIASNATGCTMMMNNYMLKILKGKIPDFVVMHDDWCHKVCLAIGGIVVFDYDKNILYRQHSNNAVGGIKKENFLKKIFSITKKDQGFTKEFIEIFKMYENKISIDNYHMLSNLIISKQSLIERIKFLFKYNPKTKSVKLNLKFFLMYIFGKY